MFTVFGRSYPAYDIDVPRYDQPLIVLSSGHTVPLRKELKETHRPAGRRDYQILYIHSGQLRLIDRAGERSVPGGTIVVFRPGEYQHYQFRPEDKPDVYWVHFTGNDVQNILRRMGITDERTFTVGVKDSYAQAYNQMIQELQLKYRNFRDMATACLMQLLCDFSRELMEYEHTYLPRTQEVEEAVKLFNLKFNENINLAEFAASLNMSLCWFTRLFQRQMGISPQKYLIEIRISRACELLGSGISVSEASEMVGYSDPAYFCRIFKKYTGHTPSEHRKLAALPDFT